MSRLKLNPTIPFGISPVSPYRKVNAGVETAAARVAEKFQLSFVQSLFSSITVEDLALIAPTTPKWIELYPFCDRRITSTIIDKAEKAGFEGLVIVLKEEMVDGFPSIPELTNEYKPRLFDGIIEQGFFGADISQLLIDHKLESNCQYVEWLVNSTKLSVVVKCDGFGNDNDFSNGIAGVCVSNHNGIANVKTATQYRIPIIISEDIISEQEAATILKSGADLILIERPIQWGFMIDEQKGIEDVLKLYTSVL
ncbi:L-lactate oxidase-like [Toxorhynchites rutilus septentrionalis]|uniref:L-lactate oxidase-like n=1 Tax=Toxorhynchites rutilus septentrionalis TaxID=329112 RepID=UPI0024786DB8|nr:L-lactate oxidase-like [Toxorhynchites rutilus septentrionalis]